MAIYNIIIIKFLSAALPPGLRRLASALGDGDLVAHRSPPLTGGLQGRGTLLHTHTHTHTDTHTHTHTHTHRDAGSMHV